MLTNLQVIDQVIQAENLEQLKSAALNMATRLDESTEMLKAILLEVRGALEELSSIRIVLENAQHSWTWQIERLTVGTTIELVQDLAQVVGQYE